MKVALLSHPGQTDLAQPYTSLPYLAAALRAHGHQVTLRDLGIEAVHHLLAEDRLESAGRACRDRFARLDRKKELSPAEQSHYLRDAMALLRVRWTNSCLYSSAPV